MLAVFSGQGGEGGGGAGGGSVGKGLGIWLKFHNFGPFPEGGKGYIHQIKLKMPN